MGKEFIDKIAPIVIVENEKRGNPLFSSVIIAQAILETGYGTSTLIFRANAVFGLKASCELGWVVKDARDIPTPVLIITGAKEYPKDDTQARPPAFAKETENRPQSFEPPT